MPIRDLLQAQIEQMGQAIGKMISKFLGLKNDGKMEEAMMVTQATLWEELGLDFEKLYKSNQTEFQFFFQDKPYSAESLTLLSTYFFEVGKDKLASQPSESKLILTKAIMLLDLADRKEDSLSMTRMAKKKELQEFLDQV